MAILFTGLFYFVVTLVVPVYVVALDGNGHSHIEPNETCFLCDPSLREEGRLWCKEHNRYEDRCWLCHPELEDENRAFCLEHGLYEDECFLCDPGIAETKGSMRKNNQDVSSAHIQAEQCEDHGIDKADCYICDPSLREKGRLWCKEHDRYEDRCWLCQPQLQDHDRAYCSAHKLYEDECIFCNPGSESIAAAAGEKDSQESPVLYCNEHDVFEHECGICQPQLASQLEPGESLNIRFGSKLSAQKAGISTAYPREISSAPFVEAYCQVRFNGNSLVQITPPASGIIRRVLVDVGSRVNSGDVLAEIHSTAIAEAKAEFLSATVDYHVKDIASKREENLVNQKISATREYLQAEAVSKMALLAMTTARQRLLDFGFTAMEIAEIEKTQESSSLFLLRAPYTGTLVDRSAVIGKFVEPGNGLFTLVDLSNMWLELSFPADQVAFVAPGLDVEAIFDSLAERTVKGKLTWVATSVDEQSRMLKARATASNHDLKLKAGMFGTARIAFGRQATTFLVPRDAVQEFERKSFLFVKVDDDLYALRRVVLGNKQGSEVTVIAGIQQGDQIVVAGSFIVMSEFLKSRLGAGCVDD